VIKGRSGRILRKNIPIKEMVCRSSMRPSCYHGIVRYGWEVQNEIKNRMAEVHKQALDYKSGV
jgi:hypothetical protein